MGDGFSVIDFEAFAAWDFEFSGIEAELVEDGGVEIGDIVRGIDGVEADFVGGAVGDACFEAAAGHPDGEAVDMVIAAIGALGAWGATEFGGEDHEGIFEEAALGEVLEEAGDGLVDGEGEFGVIGFEGGVGVPGAGAAAAVLDLDEANAAFGEASGGEELGAEFARMRQVHAVEGLGLRRFLREIENLWDGELHAGGEFVRGDAGGEGGIVGVFDASEGVEFLGEGEAEGLGIWGEWGGWFTEVERVSGIDAEGDGVVNGAEVVAVAFVPIFAVSDGDELGEILVERAEAIIDPGAEGGEFAIEGIAPAMELGLCHVIAVGGPHGADDGEAIGVAGDVGEPVGDFEA